MFKIGLEDYYGTSHGELLEIKETFSDRNINSIIELGEEMEFVLSDIIIREGEDFRIMLKTEILDAPLELYEYFIEQIHKMFGSLN